MKNRVIGGMLLALALLVVLTPRYIFPVCEYLGKDRMLCTYTGWGEMLLGAVLIAVAVGALMSRTPDALRWLMFVALVGGVVVYAFPSVIGFCRSPQMPCHYGTVPVLRLIGVLMVILSIAGIFLAGRNAGRPKFE